MRRIRALEKGARMSKILIVLLVLAVAGLGVGVRVLMKEDVQYRRVAMRELVVIDSEGRERLVGTVDAQGGMGLSWRSAEGTPQLVAAVAGDGSGSLSLSDPSSSVSLRRELISVMLI